MHMKIIFSALSLLACSLTATAAQRGELLIWINADKGYDGLQQVADRFTEQTGIRARVEHPEDLAKRFETASASGNGPDIVLWPQDRLGDFIDKGLVAPVSPAEALRDELVSVGWDAFTIGGQTWGYPVGAEAIMLVYNKALIANPPAAFEDIPALDAELSSRGVEAIGWDYTNAYFTWPIIAANGGYVFKRQADGRYDTADVGIDHPGALVGGRLLQRFVAEGVLPAGGMAGNAAELAMQAGKQAMWITGPWSWEGLRRAGIDFGVAPLPTIAGKPARPFVGVLGAMISAKSPNRDEAQRFIEQFLMTPAGLSQVNADKPIGVPLNKRLFWNMVTDEHVRISMDGVTFGRPMPSAPQMSLFWEEMTVALQAIANGSQAEQALSDAARRMRGEPVVAPSLELSPDVAVEATTEAAPLIAPIPEAEVQAPAEIAEAPVAPTDASTEAATATEATQPAPKGDTGPVSETAPGSAPTGA